MGVKEADRNKGWVNVAQCMTLRTYDAFVAWAKQCGNAPIWLHLGNCGT